MLRLRFPWYRQTPSLRLRDAEPSIRTPDCRTRPIAPHLLQVSRCNRPFHSQAQPSLSSEPHVCGNQRVIFFDAPFLAAFFAAAFLTFVTAAFATDWAAAFIAGKLMAAALRTGASAGVASATFWNRAISPCRRLV